jgi:L-malate glycosyltransferase
MTMTTQPVKILYAIDNLLRGGTELQLIGLIERLNPQEYTPYLLTIRPSDPALTPPNCKHLAWHIPSLFSLGGVIALIKLIHFLREYLYALHALGIWDFGTIKPKQNFLRKCTSA